MKAVSALVVCALLSARALAQAPSIELLDSSYRADGAIDREVEAGRPKLRAALGAGFGIAPRFEGSDQYRGRVVPVLHLAYGPFFFGAGGVGANFYRDPRWRLGASLSLGGGRRESDQLRLQGLGDIDRTVLGGLFVVYSSQALLARAHVTTDVGGNAQGSVLRVDTYARVPAGERFALFAGPGVTWADRRHMGSFFGVSAGQAARSGLPEFDAGAGVQSLRLSAGAAYRAAPNWRIVGVYSLARLQGAAAASPVIEARTQSSLVASAIYLLR